MENPKEACGRAKPPLALIPPAAEIEEAMVLAHGAAKYQPYNWRIDGIRAMTYLSAIRRHLAAYLDGEDNDPESGLSHIAHIRACAGIMLDADSIGNMEDDRPAQGQASELLRYFTQASGNDASASDSRDDGIDLGRVPRCVVSRCDDCLDD